MSDEQVQLSTREANLRRSERSIAYSYVRVSSAQQDLRGEAEGQIQTLSEYAQRGQIIADKYYADRAVSLWEGNGRIPGEQEALKQLQEDILKEPNPRKFIFATKVCRFARNRKKGKLFFDWAMKNGVTIQVLDEIFTPDELSASNWFDMCVEAEEEDQRLSKNAQEAHQRLRETSQLSGRTPWGFENYQGERRIKQDAVALVQSLYEEVRKGASIEEVSRNLSPSPQMKTSSAYRSAQKKKVREILHNPAFAGFYETPVSTGAIRLDQAPWEPAVSPHDFFQMQLLLPRRVVGYKRDRFYLDGRVNCQFCRKPLKPASTEFLWTQMHKLKFVRQAYVCREDGCRPANVYDADTLHYSVKRILETWGRDTNQPDFYENWENSTRVEQKEIIKRTFRRNFIATYEGLVSPS